MACGSQIKLSINNNIIYLFIVDIEILSNVLTKCCHSVPFIVFVDSWFVGSILVNLPLVGATQPPGLHTFQLVFCLASSLSSVMDRIDLPKSIVAV